MQLNGKWRFALDRNDGGMQDQWFTKHLQNQINLPGSLQEQGFGDAPSAQTQWISGIGTKLLHEAKYAEYERPDNFRTPFWLTPERHYVGQAWYQRDIEIPSGWKQKRVVLHLERAHWTATVWLDSQLIGTRNSLGTADDFDLGNAAAPGRHRLTICIDNRLAVAVGPDASSVTDQTQTDWNGIIGNISLRAGPKIWLDQVQIYPDPGKHTIHVVVDIGNQTGKPGTGFLNAEVLDQLGPDKLSKIPVHWDKHGGRAEFDYALPSDVKPWDEFSPVIYKLATWLNDKTSDGLTTTFGLRDISTHGTQFILNGHPIMLRGTLECCIFPRTGYPPVDANSWRRIFRICKAHGLNHMRFHSWCPPEAAFQAADEMGMYLYVECSCWAKHFATDPELDAWVAAEAQRMIRAYGNHPSFMFMVPSNEPGKDDGPFLAKLIAGWEKQDPRRLYTAGSGWPDTPANEYDVEYKTRLHDSGELTRAPQTASDYRQYIDHKKVPCVVHEMGQWCVYPDFEEIPKYTGSLRPGNLEIFQDMLNKSGMGTQAHEFLIASGKFQTQLYKTEIEEVLRTPGVGGFQLLDLHDFPGQGTAPVGILNAFWDEKPYVTPSEYRRFCNCTVPLARFAKRVFTHDETANVEIDVSHFGPADLHDVELDCKVRDNTGRTIAHSIFPRPIIPTGKLTRIDFMKLAMRDYPSLAKMNLEVTIPGTPFANDWDFWVYPANTNIPIPADVSVVNNVQDALPKLKNGGRVLLLLNPKHVAGNTHGDFAPIFWNRITFPNQVNHTLGVLCDPKSAALSQFPNDGHSDWQWWDLLQHCKPMILNGWPAGYKPIVQIIDDWDECRKLALVVDAQVNGGKLLICSMDLQHGLGHRPVARQMLRSLIEYIASNRFMPRTLLTTDQLQKLTR